MQCSNLPDGHRQPLGTIGAVVLILAGTAGLLSGNEFAYVTNWNDYSLSVIDTDQRLEVDTVSTVSRPNGVAIHPSGSLVYIAFPNDPGPAVMETATNTVVGTLAINGPRHLVVNPSGSRLYATSSAHVWEVDTSSNTVIDSVVPGGNLQGVALSPDGSKIWVATPTDDAVHVIGTAPFALLDTIAVGDGPLRLASNPSGSRIYVSNADGDSVSVIDTATNSVVSTVPVGDRPMGLATTLDGLYLYVANEFSNAIYVIDTTMDEVVDTFSAVQPLDVAAHPNGLEMYVTQLSSADSVAVVSVASNTIVDQISVGDDPRTSGIFIGPAPAFFHDDFESGDTSSWSSSVP